mmetsp:Transcript_53195/g.124632  ORF Transcript_53195/g.124632 Transcript_53195/m.124632 type:complete len:271 (+) Transcript_53195:795-1607(+)
MSSTRVRCVPKGGHCGRVLPPPSRVQLKPRRYSRPVALPILQRSPLLHRAPRVLPHLLGMRAFPAAPPAVPNLLLRLHLSAHLAALWPRQRSVRRVYDTARGDGAPPEADFSALSPHWLPPQSQRARDAAVSVPREYAPVDATHRRAPSGSTTAPRPRGDTLGVSEDQALSAVFRHHREERGLRSHAVFRLWWTLQLASCAWTKPDLRPRDGCTSQPLVDTGTAGPAGASPPRSCPDTALDAAVLPPPLVVARSNPEIRSTFPRPLALRT